MGNLEVSPDLNPSSKLDHEDRMEDGSELPTKKARSKAQGKKRTKTGCLTCRKRRIKCGEERPTCQNCTKSKRQCEGYYQRVVFKVPLSGAYRPSGSTHIPFAGPASSGSTIDHGESFQQEPASQHQIQPSIVLNPKGPFQTSEASLDRATISALPQESYQITEPRAYSFPQSNPTKLEDEDRKIPSEAPGYSGNHVDTVDRSYVPDSTNTQPPQDQRSHYDFNALGQPDNTIKAPLTPVQMSPLDWPPGGSSGSQQFSQELFYDSNRQFSAATPFFQYFPATSTQDTATTSSALTRPCYPTQNTGLLTPEGIQQNIVDVPWDHDQVSVHQPSDQLHDGFPATSFKVEQPRLLPAYGLDILEDDENDPFDVSDDDIPMEEYYGATESWHGNSKDDPIRTNALGMVVALQAGQDNQSLNLRSFTSFIDRPNMLATYVPSSRSSPLRDPMTARIFCHFVNVTGPCISMFERHPANPSLMFQGQPIPKSQQHIYTYTMPTLALRNHALLHAILALASLHIAKLQNGSIAPSLKHYHISLRRIAKSISSPSRRAQVETLAAAMLLAFYECWSADHQKWSNHIFGAQHLVRRIDFAGMSKHIKLMKMKRHQDELARYQQATQTNYSHFPNPRNQFQPIFDDVDEDIVSILMGKKLRYDQYGHIVDENIADGTGSKTYTEKELDVYETQRDLFWWYAKQDAYQSILGGGRLFMEYDLWSHCPPRSPLGRLNATYGTFDHVILLLGRVAEFASKDLKRKRLAIKANGGWRPPEMMATPNQRPPMPGPPGSQQMHQRGPPPGMPQMPSFVGMVPGVEKAKLPMGFEEWRESSPQSTSSDEFDLEAQKIEAEEEWQEIRNAFTVLQDHFGDDFQSLGPEFSAPIQTPFGTARQYRTYGIAGIWLNFYMGLIACHRAHPAMPPAAMMAAGIAARQTASYATEIGRIAAGLAPDCSNIDHVNPGVGAGLIESTTSLFVAGVQYQDAAQRAWTIDRLYDIARLTGWETSYAVAAGCETSWIRTAEMGRGPPYIRTEERRRATDTRSSTFRRVDRAFQAKGNGEVKLVVERTDRAHYALGLLGVEEDFDNLVLDGDKPKPRPENYSHDE